MDAVFHQDTALYCIVTFKQLETGLILAAEVVKAHVCVVWFQGKLCTPRSLGDLVVGVASTQALLYINNVISFKKKFHKQR